MKYNRKSITGCIMALLVAGMAISCSKDQVSEPVQTTSDVADGTVASANIIVGDTLGVVQYPDGSFVGFYEFAPGEIAIRHSQTAPQPGSKTARSMASLQVSTKLDAMSEKKRSLADIYRVISARPQAAIIQQLTDAQARLDKANAEPENAPSTVPSSKASSARTAAFGCSADYYNDNYGAKWFIDNYVNESRFRQSKTNWQTAAYGTENQSWTKICAMAPDFNTGIHFSGQRLECGLFNCDYHDRWSFDIKPRTVECWYIYSKKLYISKAAGKQPCPRVHLGVCTDGKIDPYF